jgi:hypothetical protein
MITTTQDARRNGAQRQPKTRVNEAHEAMAVPTMALPARTTARQAEPTAQELADERQRRHGQGGAHDPTIQELPPIDLAAGDHEQERH